MLEGLKLGDSITYTIGVHTNTRPLAEIGDQHLLVAFGQTPDGGQVWEMVKPAEVVAINGQAI